MRKSLAIIASALLLAVAAASQDRLRYDSTAFVDAVVTGAARAKRVEYPPCVKGVREDRCVQLYERGVKRSYKRWLSANGRGEQVADAGPGRAAAYRPCRSRADDRCQQRARVTRQARAQQRRAARTTASRRAPAQVRRAQVRSAQVRRAQTRSAQIRNTQVRRTQVRQQARAVTPRARQAIRAAPRRNPASGGTPGI